MVLFNVISNGIRRGFNTVKSTFNTIGGGIKRGIKTVFNTIGSTIKNIPVIGHIVQNTTDLIKNGIRVDLPPSVRDMINKHSYEIINEIIVERQPVTAAISTIINILSDNKLSENLKDLNYDKIFHLFMRFRTNQGSYKIEKNQVINFEKEPFKPSDSYISIDVNKTITIKELIDNAIKKFGKRIVIYDSRDNNCQRFIADLLISNDLMKPEYETFILQDAQKIYKNMGWVGDGAKVITYVAAGADLIINDVYK